MSITLLFGCCQIETTCLEMEESRHFFTQVLGGGPIEQELANQIDTIAPHTAYRCDHIGLGDAVFQLNQPDPAMIFNGHKSIHQAYLDSVGPSVTNLNFFVDDHAHARELLTGLGAPIHLDGPSSAAPALADYGPDNSRAGGDERPFMFVGTRGLIGLDLEIMEPNFHRFVAQSAQYPAYVQPRPQVGDGNILLQRLHIVVKSLEEVFANLTRIFTPASRSKPYSYREGPSGRSFRVGLGGIEIEYSEPRRSTGPLADALDRTGPGIATIAFAARDIAAILRRARGRVDIATEPDWLGTGIGDRPAALLASRAIIGFDTVLEPWSAEPFPDAG